MKICKKEQPENSDETKQLLDLYFKYLQFFFCNFIVDDVCLLAAAAAVLTVNVQLEKKAIKT